MGDSSVTAGCFITKIPDIIIVDIFVKLSVATLIQCRRVCKSWRRFLSSPFFAQSFQATEPPPLVICRSGILFYFLQGEELSLAAISTHPKGSTFASQNSVLHLVNSCNGLLCMTRCTGKPNRKIGSLLIRGSYGERVFIVNPITDENIALPACPKDMSMIFCGLGFCSETNQFKALRVLSETSDESLSTEVDMDDDDVEFLSTVVEVYTLGSGNWRRIDVDFHSLRAAFLCKRSIDMLSYASGSMYWISDMGTGAALASFDFETERFQQVSKFSSSMRFINALGTFKDTLYLCCCERVLYDPSRNRDVDNYDGEHDRVELFLLKGAWSSEFIVNFPNDFRMDRYRDRVIQVFENGDLLLCMDNYLHLFKKEKKDFKRFSDCLITSKEDAVVHVPSFLSLKDIVKGEHSKVLNLGSNAASPDFLLAGAKSGDESDEVVVKSSFLAELQHRVYLAEAVLK